MKKSSGIIISLLLIGFVSGGVFARQNITKRDIKPAQPAQPTRQVEKVGPNIQQRELQIPTVDPTKINVIKTGNFNAADRQFQITACTMSDGNIFIGWEAFADKAGYSYKWRAGRCSRYNTQIRQLGVDMIYTETRNSYMLEGNSAVPFANGNVLVAFDDKETETSEKGRFVLLSPEMSVLKGPVTFCQGRAGSVSAASMLDGDAALIAYSDSSSETYQGKFLIVNSNGDIITQPKAFTFKGDVTNVCAGTTWNGKAFIAYNCGEDGSLSIEVNVLGNLSRNIRPIWNYRKLTALAVCPLSNKNTLVLGNWNNSAQCLPVGPDGKPAGDFQSFNPQQVSDIQATLLSNDNVFISFITPDEKVMSVVVDSAGKLIKGPIETCESFSVQPGLGLIAQTKIQNDMVLVINHGYRKEPTEESITKWMVLK